MKQTIKLSLIYFKEQLYAAFSGFNKKAKAKTLPTIIILFIFLACAIGYSLYNIAEMLNVFGMSQNILIVGSFMALFMSLMITLTDVQGVMYNSKDYSLLMSLPIKNISIISAKYLGGYLTSMLYFTAIEVPTFIVYFIFNGVTALSIIFGLISILFMPAFSQLISSILAFMVNVLTSRMKNKNILRTIFTLIFAIGLAIFISLSNSEFMGELFVGGVPLWFKIIFSNIYFLFISITNLSFVYYIYAILVSLLFIILGVSVVLLGYKKINSALMITKIKGKPAPIAYQGKSIFSRLFKKEITTFFNSTVYCVNGLIGLIMSIVSTCIVLTVFFKMPLYPVMQDICGIMMLSCMAMCLGVAPTTSVSFSIEGSKLQNLKSLPIKFRDIVLSKCALNLMLSVPVILVCTIVFGITSKISFLLCILILIYLLITTLSQTVLGLLLNLKFPRLNWTSETQAVKNGASMLITMFLDILLGIVPMIVFLIWFSYSTWLTLTIFMPMIIALQLIYAIVIIIIFIKKAEKIYNNIQV